MIRYKQLLALLVDNDKTYPVEIGEWALARLSPAEYQQCMSELFQVVNYEEEEILKGNFVRLPDLFETFNTEQETFTSKVGIQYETSENFVKHEKLLYWQQRMIDDPAVIYYHPEVIPTQG